MKKRNNTTIRERSIFFLLIIYDVFSVNVSFFIALTVRFYLNGSFSKIGIEYLPAFIRFAPYYTVCSIIVFFLFHMYGMVWRAAGINDLKRITYANICTCVIQVAGTVIFVKRMPITYYVIGAIIQFVLVSLIRFVPRMLIYEGMNDVKVKDAVPSMIVGIGDNAIILQDRMRKNQIENRKAVCVLDYSSEAVSKKLFNGLPIIHGMDNLSTAIGRYSIGCMIIANRTLPEEVYERLSAICEESDIELREFTIDTEKRYGKITLFELMKVYAGEIKVISEGKDVVFNDGIQACKAIGGASLVKRIVADDKLLVVYIETDNTYDSNSKKDWMQKYEDEYNEEVTFF